MWACISDVRATFPGATTMQAGVRHFCRLDGLSNSLGIRTCKKPEEVVTAGAHAAQKAAEEFGQQEFREVVPDGRDAVQVDMAFPCKMHHPETLREMALVHMVTEHMRQADLSTMIPY